MSGEGIFSGMEATVMQGLNSVIQGQMSLYSAMMAGLVAGSATLYIFWRGYQTLAGKLHTPVEDVAWDLARMGIILAFVTNADGYLDASVAAINGLKSGLSGSENVWVLLDTLWGKAQRLGETLFNLDDSTYVPLNGGLAELLVWGGTIVVLVIATIVNMGAEIMLLLMTTTAPLFIFCLIYGFLHPMFNNWLQVIFSALLTLMFSALSLRIAIEYLSRVLDKARGGADINNIVTLAAQCCLAAIGAGFVIWLAAKIAGSLAGASVQGAVQGAAKMGLIASGDAVKKSASCLATPIGNTLGSIGEKAASNLKGPLSPPNAKAAAKAAVAKMKAQH
ncbi:type IV secretion system protein [Citrobacter sp. JGM124]|uniref:type IV secretion system protein n=1 Tax=Citrobacter sp. JGM124 TaxID=2799789 RepID=UPI001BAB1F34|nr:type IV secretion system protein [Citrobacter sp. JGM124]MBS0847039.1 type IV secretion system protein [Citrobacter sp. JGM124]